MQCSNKGGGEILALDVKKDQIDEENRQSKNWCWEDSAA